MKPRVHIWQILRVVEARELGYHVWIVAERGIVRVAAEIGRAAVADYEAPSKRWFQRRLRCHGNAAGEGGRYELANHKCYRAPARGAAAAQRNGKRGKSDT